MGAHTVVALLLLFSVVSIIAGVVFLAIRWKAPPPPQDAYECPYCVMNDCPICNGH